MKYWPTILMLSILLMQWNICDAQDNSMLNSKNFEIIYKYTYQPDSNLYDSKKSLYMQLDIQDGISQFQSLKKRELDSSVNANQSNIIYYSYGMINPNNYLIEKKSDDIKTYESINGIGLDGNNELFEYTQPRSVFDWTLYSDTDTIAGYLCQKASTYFGGRKWFAWFSLEIPIFEGPYKFCNLPGLIISISDEENFFLFEFSSIKNKVNLLSKPQEIRRDLVVKKVDQHFFFNERKKFRGNMIEFAILQGNKVSEKQKEYIRTATKGDNNHIEKY